MPLLRSLSRWITLALALGLGAATGIFALRSIIWAVALALAGAVCAAVFLHGKWVRSIAVTLASVAACLLIGEGMIVAVQRMTDPGEDTVRYEPAPLFVRDSALGWLPRPSSTIHAVRTKGARTIFDVTYTIGADGFRVTPASRPEGETVLFLGDSFVFGDAINDADTLPQLFAIATGCRFHVANLGVSAYGPHQVLGLIEQGKVDPAVKGPVRLAFMYLLDDHPMRAAGDLASEWWWQVAPQYETTRNGGVRLLGTAADVRTRRSTTAKIIDEAISKSFIASFSRRILRIYPQMELVEALIRRIRLLVKERYGVELVVLYWSKDPTGFYPSHVTAMLERAGAEMFVLRPLLDEAGLKLEDAEIPGDGHPNRLRNKVIAGALARRYAQ
jgi:hypothetical protein